MTEEYEKKHCTSNMFAYVKCLEIQDSYISEFFPAEFDHKVVSESRNTKETKCRLLGYISLSSHKYLIFI